MDIGIDARFYHSRHAGISRYTKGLLHALFPIDKKNHYTVFLYPEAMEEWEVKQSNVETVITSVGHYSWAEQAIFPFDLLKRKFDLVHFCNFNHPVLYPGKFIVTVHDLAYFLFPGKRLKGPFVKPAFKLTMRSAILRAKKIIAVTGFARQEIIQNMGADPSKVVAIPEGVDRNEFRSVEKETVTALKKKYGLSKPVIFYVGQWRVHKNIPVLLEGFRLLREKGVMAQLVLGGTSDPAIASTIENHPFKKDIKVMGFIPDAELPSWYQLADVFAFPSRYEGFGLPVVEAQALGVPVVSSSASTLPEIGGKGALYFDPDRPEQLSEHLSTLLSKKDLRARMIRLGRENLKRFDWERTARDTLKIYEEVANGRFNH
jgi:glycosyltransferase involved in cell wall biosynthesis